MPCPGVEEQGRGGGDDGRAGQGRHGQGEGMPQAGREGHGGGGRPGNGGQREHFPLRHGRPATPAQQRGGGHGCQQNQSDGDQDMIVEGDAHDDSCRAENAGKRRGQGAEDGHARQEDQRHDADEHEGFPAPDARQRSFRTQGSPAQDHQHGVARRHNHDPGEEHPTDR